MRIEGILGIEQSIFERICKKQRKINQQIKRKKNFGQEIGNGEKMEYQKRYKKFKKIQNRI